MPEQSLNIYQKLAKIRKPVEVLQKDKRGYGYTYASDELILAKITGLMDKYNVSLVPNILRDTLKVEPYTYKKTKTTKDGKTFEENVNEILVSADMEWYWVNNDDPSDRIIVPWVLVGQQSDASQSFGSGLSYCSRYFKLSYFNVATSDNDPDHWRSMQREAEDAENREIAKQIVEKINALVNAHLESNKDDREAIIEIAKKYAKDGKGRATGNYMAITDPAVAANLLKELTETFKWE